MPEISLITNHRRCSQVRDFSGLVFGSITPTDVDMLIEYHDRYFITAETKLIGAELPTGQRLALARQCDTCQTAGKPSIVFITVHNTPLGQNIIMAKTRVIEFRYHFRWHQLKGYRMLKDAIENFINWQELDRWI